MDPTTRLRHFLEYFLGRFFFEVIGRVPEVVGRPGGRALGRAVGALLSARSRRAADNLRRAFPGAGEPEVRAWVRGMWSNLGEALWEFAQLPALTAEKYFRWVEVEGLEHLRASFARGKGVVLFAGHLTNWEWTTLFISFSGLPVAAVARRIKNPRLNDFLTRLRSTHGVTMFLHKNAVREGLRWVKQGKVLGILIDQRITAGGVRVPFFGRPAYTTPMPGILAMRTGAAVHGVCARREGGKVKIRVEPEMDMAPFGGDAGAAAAAMTAEVERWIRADPSCWLWMHDRWKE